MYSPDLSPHRFLLLYKAAIAIALLLIAMPGHAGADRHVQSTDNAMQATPIVPVSNETAPGDFSIADETATSLSLTIDSNDQVNFGEIEPGQTVILAEAVTVSISNSEGAWQLSCSGEEGSGHTTTARVGDLAFSDSGADAWTPFDVLPASCLEQANGNATMIYDYKLTVPANASPGDYQVIVTYSVEALP